MALTPRSRRWLSLVMVLVSIAIWMIAATIHVGRSVHADQAAAAPAHEIQLGTARTDSMYAVTLGVKDPAQLQGNDAVRVTLKDAQGEIESKWLHPADLDFYLTLRPRAAGPVTVSLTFGIGREGPWRSARR